MQRSAEKLGIFFETLYFHYYWDIFCNLKIKLIALFMSFQRIIIKEIINNIKRASLEYAHSKISLNSHFAQNHQKLLTLHKEYDLKFTH